MQVKYMTKNFGKYDVTSLASYQAVGGLQALAWAQEHGAEAVLARLVAAKIKGRGGAGYDMGRKWTQARAVVGEPKVIICNADEGEPSTFKDRALLQYDPMNLLEAMLIAGYVVGARDGYIYLREEYAHLRAILLQAIKTFETAGLLGENALGEGKPFFIHLYSGAGAYVCGEGTALIRSIEGKSGRPRMKPPYIKQSGLFARPTCVNNVESLSIVPHLLLDEKDKYFSYGTEESIGTKLISVAGNVNHPGVFEIAFGTTIREIVEDLAGGIQGARAIRLLQFGGASGRVASPAILDVPYTYEDLQTAGVTVGSGAILVIDERTSVLDFLTMTQDFFYEESCGQCTPCREGNRHLRMYLRKFQKGEGTQADFDTMMHVAHIMPVASLCGLGESAENALFSALEVFPDTFAQGGVRL